MTRPSTGWYVEVDHSGGHTFTPDVVGEPERNPTVNGLPTITIPVPQSERWFDTEFEDAPMRVWKDGVRQPIDQMQRATKGEDRTVLHGRGGLELLTRVQAEYEAEQIHTAAENLITNNTSYVANVDAPNSTVQTNQTVQSADTTSELQSQSSVPATTPVGIASGKVELLQSAFVREGEADVATGTRSDSNASDGSVTYFGGEFGSAGQASSHSITVDYTIPAANVGVAWRWKVSDSDGDGDTTNLPAMDVNVAGENVFTYSDGWGTTKTGYNWLQETGGLSSDLTPGTYTMEVKQTAASGSTYDEFWLDLLVVYDTRYTYTFDNANDGAGGYLDGPQLFPDLERITFEDTVPTDSVAGGRIETTTWNDTSNKQEVGFSPDRGTTWYTAANTTSHEADFTDLHSLIRARLGLSRFGSRTTATPQTGFNGQTVDAFTLKADLDDTPLLSSQRFDGQLVDILSEFADQADALFEYRLSGGTESFEWTHPGQRPVSQTADVARYEASQSTENRYQKAAVYGKYQRIIGEQFTATHGTAINLAKSRFQETSEVVRNPNSGTVFERVVDYQLDTENGEITTLASGQMTDGQSYSIDYDYKTYGEYTQSGVTNPDEVVQHIPGLTTNRSCNQVARQIVEVVKEPLKEATVTIPKQPVGWEVINEIDVAELPFPSTSLQMKEITETPQEVVVRLGSRETISEVVSDIRTRVQAVSERV